MAIESACKAPFFKGGSSSAITALAALLCIVVIYACAYRAGGAVAGFAAALLFACFPEVWRSTTHLLTEIPFMLFYTPAVIFFHRGVHVDGRNFLLAWPCFALALMTRYTAVLFAPTCILIAAVPLLMRDGAAIDRMRSRHFLLGPLLAALMLAPMLARAWFHFGDPLTGFRAASRQLPDYSRHARMPVYHYVTLLPSMVGWLPAIALPVAIGDALARRDRLGISCVIAAAVIVAWLSQYGWKEPRLVSAALPFVAIAIGIGIGRLWREVGGGAAGGVRRAAIGALPVVLALAIQLDPNYARAARQITGSVTLGYPSFLDAMEQIRRDTPATAVLMGPNCYQISWYARRRCLPVPAERPAPAAWLRLASDADVLIVTSFERGQPAWLNDVLARLQLSAGDRLATFRDARFSTALVPTNLVAAALVEPAERQ
jgi:4-amino-4-deoxy-L-arabinose transferase-like glycosyltransferase